MNVYLYNSVTFEYTGTKEARESPREPGVYLCPANAVLDNAPPSCGDNEIATFDTGAQVWGKVADYRGITYYNKTTKAVTTFEIGETPGSDVTELEPLSDPCNFVIDEWVLDTTVITENKWATLRAERNGKLTASDWTALSDCPLTSANQTEWTTYRQYLRDLPANTSDIDNIVWPTVPDEIKE